VQPFASQLILLDVLLSGSDGREFCSRLKGNDETKHIIVIMFSAHPGAAGQMSDCGADDFVPRLFHLHSLWQRVLSHMEAAA
jgi:DNA-binding response OmpR family regulator